MEGADNEGLVILLVAIFLAIFLLPMIVLLIAEPGDEKRDDWFGLIVRKVTGD